MLPRGATRWIVRDGRAPRRYAPTQPETLYQPSAQPTVAPTTETAAPSVTPVPTASKAQAVVGTLQVTGLTIAQCIATKPVLAQALANTAGVSVTKVSVGCDVASTRRRLTGGEELALVLYFFAAWIFRRTSRGDAAAGAWIFRGDESLGRGYSGETSRGELQLSVKTDARRRYQTLLKNRESRLPYGRVDTPAFSRAAAEGVLFRTARARADTKLPDAPRGAGIAATPRPRRGHSAKTIRGAAGAAGTGSSRSCGDVRRRSHAGARAGHVRPEPDDAHDGPPRLLPRRAS